MLKEELNKIIIEKNGFIIFKCHVQPGAKRNSIIGIYSDSLKISLSAPPIEGKANKELIKYLSKILNISKNSLTLLSGEKNKNKIIQCKISKADFLKRIYEL